MHFPVQERKPSSQTVGIPIKIYYILNLFTTGIISEHISPLCLSALLCAGM